ncbi:ANTAR domain-containing protein [Thermomonospora umbrina]|uniref:ANTAR domain-containing protein n=1 Tax=Thermomonospora umbrina TaxID=111806 RepID=A0A3D9SM39_9ACTN|nr:ANTAR domain-containing protein [Thermomonospora umbrina]
MQGGRGVHGRGPAGRSPANGLPVITTPIEMLGPATITRSSLLTFRLFEVRSAGSLTLTTQVSLTNGSAVGDGGAILNRGAVTLTRSSLSGNFATGNGGGLANADTPSGTAPAATFTRSPVSDNTSLLRGGGIYNGLRGTLTTTGVSGSPMFVRPHVSSRPSGPAWGGPGRRRARVHGTSGERTAACGDPRAGNGSSRRSTSHDVHRATEWARSKRPETVRVSPVLSVPTARTALLGLTSQETGGDANPARTGRRVAVVPRDRAAVVRAAIEGLARAEGVSPASIVHVCRACVRVAGATGVCASVPGEKGLYEPVCAVGPAGAPLAELQTTVGEGPGMETVAGDRLVLVTDLETADAQRRWPLFAPAAVELGTAAVFAFPLLIGATAVGALEIHWGRRPSRDTMLTDGLLFADAALSALMARLVPEGNVPDRAGEAGEPFLDRWPEVHQAAGMMSVQLRVRPGEAYARLRAHAYANDQSLRDVAHEVVERRLTFSPDKGPDTPCP